MDIKILARLKDLLFLRNMFKKRQKKVNISICGLDKAGKTTIVRYIVAGEYKSTIPTFGINREVVDLPNLQLDIFDLGGQEDFRGLWPEINEKSDGLIFVVDSTDYFRLDLSKDIFHNIINTQIDIMIPVLLLLNKCDMENRMHRAEFVDYFSLTSITNIKWACFVTSAISGEGIYDAFKWFIDCFQE